MALPTSKFSTLTLQREISFKNFNELKEFLFPRELQHIENKIYQEIQKEPTLLPRTITTKMSLDELRRISIQKSYKQHLIRLRLKQVLSDPYYDLGWSRVVNQLDNDCGVYSKTSLKLFSESLLNLGTERHMEFYKDCCALKYLGSFCLTEIGHGSNTKQMETTATYDNINKEFIIHTPTFTAAKCWSLYSGISATHAVVYAQLITPDNEKRGLNAFIVPIRSPKNLLPFPGVCIGDIGEKLGLQGLDNGLIIFNQYRIPKVNLLNRLGDVTDDGKYVKNSQCVQPLSVSFKVLSQGRLELIIDCCMALNLALISAFRYSAFTNQTKPKDNNQLCKHQSYPSHLIPYLAGVYTSLTFLNYFIRTNNDLSANNLMITEIHAILSTGKSYFSFLARDGIQECLEVCAHMGYLSVSNIGRIRSRIDPIVTVEGDNNVLVQQTSNWLLKFWLLVMSKKNISTPLKSLEFLNDTTNILQLKFQCKSVANFHKPHNICNYYQWLVCYLLKKSYDKCEYLRKTKSEAEEFWVKSRSQIHHLKDLSTAYFENILFRQTYLMIASSTVSSATKDILNTLISLYAVWSLQKHVSNFYEGQYTNSPLFSKLIEDSILILCNDFNKKIPSLVDAIALPDDLMPGILGHSDGQVYTRLHNLIMQNSEAFSCTTWSNNL